MEISSTTTMIYHIDVQEDEMQEIYDAVNTLIYKADIEKSIKLENCIYGPMQKIKRVFEQVGFKHQGD